MMAFSKGTGELQVTAAQADVVQKALRYWSRSDRISADLADSLMASVHVVEEEHGFDWDRFAKYTFRLAVICLTIAMGNLIFGGVIPRIIKRIVALPSSLRIIITSALAIMVHVWAYQRSLVTPHQRFLHEATHSLGALLFALTAVQLGHTLEATKKENSRVFHNIELSLAIVYGLTAVLAQSNFIWSCGIIVFGTWFGSRTAYAAGTYYLGMDYPLHFVFLGSAFVMIAGLMRNHPITATLWSPTRIWGILYLFVALWVLSLFGNDKLRGDNYPARSRVARMAFWSILFLCAAATSIWHGLRYGDSTTKGFGLTFLAINIYTKVFEFFWRTSYQTMFFFVMAFSLALLGRYAESMNEALNEYSHVLG